MCLFPVVVAATTAAIVAVVVVVRRLTYDSVCLSPNGLTTADDTASEVVSDSGSNIFCLLTTFF